MWRRDPKRCDRGGGVAKPSQRELERLQARIHGTPVSQDVADHRAHAKVAEATASKSGRLTFVVDESLPPESIVRVEGSTVTLSSDMFAALERHEKKMGAKLHPLRSVKRRGAPYRGS